MCILLMTKKKKNKTHIKHKNTIPVIIISTIIDNRYTEDIYMNTNTNTSRRKIKKFLQQVVP
jgi:hypothetical protein